MDQMIRFRCECGKKLKATRDIIGKKVRCTNCVRTHHVPESDHLPPKKLLPTPKPPISKPEQPTAKSTSTEQAKKAIESKQQKNQQNLAVSKTEKLTASKSKANKSKPNIPPESPSLIIPDEMAAKEPSLLPTNDDSDSRFKLDPKFDPEPSDSPLNPTINSEFGFDAPKINTEQTIPSPRAQLPKSKRPISKTKLIIGAVAAFAGLLLLTTIAFLMSGDSALPAEFSEQPEVRNYVRKIQQFRKSQQTLKIVSEAYVKSKSPTAEERKQIEAFNRSIEPLANQQIKLGEALELFKSSEHEKARSTLIAATQTLDEKIPELESKAKDFSSKLR